MKSTISQEQLQSFMQEFAAVMDTKKNIDGGYDALALYCAFNACSRMLGKDINIDKLIKELSFAKSNEFEDKQDRINFLVNILPGDKTCGCSCDNALSGGEITKYFSVRFR